jgi:hypothetical protein
MGVSDEAKHVVPLRFLRKMKNIFLLLLLLLLFIFFYDIINHEL